jgi:hypothetical protein
LQPLLRYFAAVPPKPGPDPYPPNPWTNSFSGGTQISSGLAVAHASLTRGRPAEGADPPRQRPRHRAGRRTAGRAGVQTSSVRRASRSGIVAVSPRADNLSLFKNLAGPGAFTHPVRGAGGGIGQTEGAQATPMPWALIALALCVLAALAANEHWCGRLPVPRTSA